jgi:hypothetical protein
MRVEECWYVDMHMTYVYHRLGAICMYLAFSRCLMTYQ